MRTPIKKPEENIAECFPNLDLNYLLINLFIF